MAQQREIFLAIFLACVARVRSESSCLVQLPSDSARAIGALGSPFSRQQKQCIDDYVSNVKTVLPNYTLDGRSFGGKIGGEPLHNPPILGAGFGSTATRSVAALARALNLQVEHCPSQGRNETWMRLYRMMTADCKLRVELNDIDFKGMIAGEQKQRFWLDTPLAELFLDFYAASPKSKVVLTLRPAKSWCFSRQKHHGNSPVNGWPLQSPCGKRLSELSCEDAAKLFNLHTTLVRCMVPSKNLLEINVFESSVDPNRVAKFFGVPTKHHLTMPHISFSFEAEALGKTGSV